MLQRIEEALREVSDLVFYGSAEDVANTALWNYLVFFRTRTARSATNKGLSDHYNVAVVHENWVPDEMIDAIIDRMEGIDGMRLAGDVEFEYSRKPSTSAVLEIAVIPFVRPRKRV